MHISMKNMKGR